MQNVLKQVGASGQFAIGKQFAGKYFELNTRPDGVIELTPMAVIPQSQAWVHTPEMQAALAESTKWMAANPPRTDNADEILDRLDAHAEKLARAEKQRPTASPTSRTSHARKRA